jgi:integrase
MARMQPVRVPQKLPVVLSREEVKRLIAACRSLKHQIALSVAYGAGLRASEVAALKVGDIDSDRMILRIEQGKGHKDRYAILSPVLLERLRHWWRVGRMQGKLLDGGWLFPGMNPVDPISTRQLNRAIHAAADAAEIDPRVSMHTLRHYLPFLTMSCDRDELARAFDNCWSQYRQAQPITRHSSFSATGYVGSRGVGPPAYSALAYFVKVMSSKVLAPSSKASHQGRFAWSPPIHARATRQSPHDRHLLGGGPWPWCASSGEQ